MKILIIYLPSCCSKPYEFLLRNIKEDIFNNIMLITNFSTIDFYCTAKKTDIFS